MPKPTQEQLQAAAEQMARGVALLQAGRGDEALMCLDTVLDTIPNFPSALTKRGSVYQALGRYDEAAADFERCLSLFPAMTHVRFLRDGVLQAQLHALQAEAETEAIPALEKRAGLLVRLQRDMDALHCFERMLEIDAGHVAALSGMGHALLRLQRHDEAQACYARVLKLAPQTAPEYAATLFNRGNVLQQQARYAEALDDYAGALALVPTSAEVMMEQAHCHLVQGQFETGWPLFEARWNTRQLRNARLQVETPMWCGETVEAGKTLLLWAEQGLGDTLQFVRYLPLASQRAKDARVVLRVPAGLKNLLAYSMERLGLAVQVIDNDEPLPAHDCHCPLMSLPLVCQSTLQTIPAAIPYLFAPEASTAKWRERLSADQKPRVGLIWAGGQRLLNNPTRDMRAAFLRPLLELPVLWVGLQQAISEEDRGTLQDMPPILDLGDELGDFADTAGLISQLDLVVSIDSSVAHLAGALDKPVCLMLRKSGEWRWLHGRDDSPWYPQHRLFRQQRHGDWNGVVQQIFECLSRENLA